jgi:hypothetical protein
MKFRHPDLLVIQGYFVGTYKVLVLGETDSCFDLSTEKRQAAESIKTIAHLGF